MNCSNERLGGRLIRQLSLVENNTPGDVEQRLEDIAKGIETVQATAIIKIGERLAEARDLFKYDRREGGFEGWCQTRLNLSRSTAYNMISVHEQLGESVQRVGHFADLPARVLYALAAPSTSDDVRDRVEQLLIDGQKVTAADVKRMKSELQSSANQSYEIRDKAEKAVLRAKHLEAEAESVSQQAEKIHAIEARASRLAQEKRELRDEIEILKRRLEKLTSAELPPAQDVATENVVKLSVPEKEWDDSMSDTAPTSGVDAWHQIGGSLSIMLNTKIEAPEFWRISHQRSASREDIRDKVFRGLTMLAKLAEGYDA